MKKLNLLLALVVLLTFAACSKAKTIERHLSRKTGKWLIAKQTIYLYTDGSIDSYGGISNAGSMVFEKDGSVVWTKIYPGGTETESGTWSNTVSEVNLVIDGQTIVFKIKDESRREMRLENTETYTDGNGSVHKTETTLEMDLDT